jgi:hypothetical protein
MMKRLGTLIVVVLCLGSVPAHAVDEVTLGQFLDTYRTGYLEERAKLEGILGWMQDGMAVSNATA